MAIIEKTKNYLATLDLTPISFNIPGIVNVKAQLEKLQEELLPLQDVNEQNINLAFKLKDLRKKYIEEKAQHKKTRKLMHTYYQAEKGLNIQSMFCPDLKKEINLVNCNASCRNGYCQPDRGYNCATRINAIIDHFKIPTE